jgi:mono/diheme cytochrome c family protein
MEGDVMTFRRVVGIAAVMFIAGSAAIAAADGAAIYTAQCAKCHGDTGHADTTIGKAMKVPALAGDANIQKMSAADIAARIKGNAKHPPTVKGLSDDDDNAVAAYVKELAGK